MALRKGIFAIAYLVRFTAVSSAYVRVRNTMIRAPNISIPVASLNKKASRERERERECEYFVR